MRTRTYGLDSSGSMSNPLSITWLSLLPYIPLANAVPVVWCHLDPDRDLKGVVVGTVAIFEERERPLDDKLLRVDLSDPQGFAYALRWFWNNDIGVGYLGLFARADGWEHAPPASEIHKLALRVELGSTTDEDCERLSRAMRRLVEILEAE